VQYIDLNLDGVKDLLVTTNTASGKGAVFGYSLKGDLKNGPSAWNKFKLADGYKPRNWFLPGAGSPGTALAFHVNPKDTTSRPYIVVSADDGGFVDLLIPNSNNSNDWVYNKKIIMASQSYPVGTVAVADLDNSGAVEVIIPSYGENKIDVYSFDL